ncbi:MAG: phosphoribosylformylglycinamidine synthase [Oscillospiraceae bacterium]|nr:phosphoribosylformylglycinamidine synthase [Oscillospiraceae bacterium]
MSVFRIYVEKKASYAVEAKGLLSEINNLLQIKGVTSLRLFNRYDVEGIDEALFNACKMTVFAEPQLDNIYDHRPKVEGAYVFGTEYLPGQFDQRADSCAQCISIVGACDRPAVRTARVFILEGSATDAELAAIKKHVINPVESREAILDKKPETLAIQYEIPTEVATLTGFIGYTQAQLADFVKQYGLAMDLDDIKFCQNYFITQQRDPTITEIRMIDTYWSDHCRHTTFGTIIDDAKIEDSAVQAAFEKYLQLRSELYAGKNKPMCLMDMAVIGTKKLKKDGMLPRLDESEEINACTVKIDVDVEGETQEWLFLFKNETHNHPTEIEPFGGAATCIGGAIRDPLSGRSYVYQAMRVTGAADPLKPVSETLEGKLPQSKIVTTAAAGYSSYGNQIGLATGQVDEIYHPGYVAKRMEIGAVVGAAPAANVRRERPNAGDIVVLLGGQTGRDGCGGATGSSKKHSLESLESCGAEVQKGNAPEERKLQRLFRNPDVTKMIKRCNDFGAGGVSVAIGELADGLVIDLNAVPKKYDGLDGTELAISESQERMAVVLEKENVDAFIAEAAKENLQASVVAEVTEAARLVMKWNGRVICDINREFLNSNGAEKHISVTVPQQSVAPRSVAGTTVKEKMENLLGDLNVCSKKGLSQRFDSTIGAGTVLMPFGGKYQLTPAQAMAAKIPVLYKETTTCSGMAYGFNPYISEQSPYCGAYLAVVESVAKLVATGFSYKDAYLTFQEYFERLGQEASRWGKPFSALLGALKAQTELGIASIGGKDSMSGSFENIDVPPTLTSFAVSIGNTENVISPEFKVPFSKVCYLEPKLDEKSLPTADSLKAVFDTVEQLIADKKVLSAYTPTYGGIAEGVFKMGIGNGIGFAFADGIDEEKIFAYNYGAFILEMTDDTVVGTLLGETTADYSLIIGGEKLDMSELCAVYENKLEPVFPYHSIKCTDTVKAYSYSTDTRVAPKIGVAKPKVLIPVFPGNNCEYDTANALIRAGAQPEILVVRNLSAQAITESVDAMEKIIKESQMIVIPGGFSGGDEPDGSGKFITAFFRNPKIKDAVHDMLKNRDGLMCGICNGFQALIKLGLVPYGEIIDTDENCPTLTFNTIARHQSGLVRTRIASNKSPWLSKTNVGDVHTIAISHGEGRFVAPAALIEQLAQNGQIATQYADLSGEPTMDICFNPNTSMQAVEGITSPDGRVLGKMGHTERYGHNVYKNVEGNKAQQLFEGAVSYFAL